MTEKGVYVAFYNPRRPRHAVVRMIWPSGRERSEGAIRWLPLPAEL